MKAIQDLIEDQDKKDLRHLISDAKEIVNSIGSPFGEGSEYNGVKRKEIGFMIHTEEGSREGSCHLSDEEFDKMLRDIVHLAVDYANRKEL